jgi:hypothetical protein
VFFCQDIFGDVPKALSVKEKKAIPDKSTFWKRAFFRTFVLFFSYRLLLYASRLTSFPLVWFRPGRVRVI